MRDQATRHLAHAAEHLGPGRARAAALCAARAAALHLQAGQPEPATRWTRHATDLATGIRSARLTAYLTSLHTAAAEPDNQPALSI